MDFGSIMYNYVWLGFVKLIMALYSIGGAQFALGVIVGVCVMMFGFFFRKIIVWLILLFLIASIGIGIFAADIDWHDIKDGNWTKMTNVTQTQYQNAQNQVIHQQNWYPQQQYPNQDNQQPSPDDSWSNI